MGNDFCAVIAQLWGMLLLSHLIKVMHLMCFQQVRGWLFMQKLEVVRQ